MIGGMLSATYCKTWWGFVFVYCSFYPAGIGLVYYTPIMCGWEWYPNHRGIITGIIVAGYGFGAFFYGFISTAIVNPNDLKPVA
jgi:OFA family oxalate/formate antiporter-like MFS transporter